MGNGLNQFLLGLPPGKKRNVDEVSGRHEIEFGTPVIVEEQPKDLRAHLDPLIETIDLSRVHRRFPITLNFAWFPGTSGPGNQAVF